MKHGWKLITIGLILSPLHFLAVMIDAETGWLGGGPGDANIGLGILGFLVWAISIALVIQGVSDLRNSKK